MDGTAQTPPETSEGISTTGTLRRISETFLSILHNRLELMTLEIQEEKHWAISMLMLAAFAIAFGILTIVAVLVTIAVLVPAEARVWVMPGICLVTIGGTVVCALALKKKLNRPAPLGDTLAELRKDIACLRNGDDRPV
jgi:uncharacterized membrane protein YqjE